MTQSKNCNAINETTSEKTKSSKSEISIWQSILKGSVSGATEVFIDHPLWSIKTRMQSAQPFTLNPSILYRGLIPNATSMIPITAMQVGLNQMIMNIFYKNSSELTATQKLSCAFIAGVGSAFASCPTEMVMTHQGMRGGSFLNTGKYLVKQGGFGYLYSGLVTTMMREGVFTAFYIAVTPIIKKQLTSYCPNEYLASLASGMTAGVGATMLSQSVDTIKTVQQQQPMSIAGAVKKIYASNGLYGFFKGFIPRGTRVMSAVTIMGWVGEQMENSLQRSNQSSDENNSIKNKR